jgi:hypothetical protein
METVEILKKIKNATDMLHHPLGAILLPPNQSKVFAWLLISFDFFPGGRDPLFLRKLLRPTIRVEFK